MLGNFTKISELKYRGVDFYIKFVYLANPIPLYQATPCLLRKDSKLRITLKNLVYPITCYQLKFQVSWISRTLSMIYLLSTYFSAKIAT